MKLLYCAHCGDIVRLFPKKRSCLCGKSWGYYQEDGATTLQTYPGLSIGLANPDFRAALERFTMDPNHFSPELAIRCWINPLSEPDVKFVEIEEETPDADSPGDFASQDQHSRPAEESA